jgi:4'-phosphopantetheinyl transferase
MNRDPFWLSPPSHLALGPDEVHVWRASLELTEAQVDALIPLLAADEQHRADGYCRAELRTAFVAARARLRLLLGQYLRIAPVEVQFVYNVHGRPELSPEMGCERLNFNLSHSGTVVLYAFAWQRQVGVDVERPGRRLEFESIAGRFFSAHETNALTALPESERRAAFFRGWTRKEAFIKATGRGLSYGLGRFDVSLAPHEPARLLRADWDDPRAWTLRDLPAGLGYAAALAVEGGDWTLRAWQWPDASAEQHRPMAGHPMG